MGSKRCRGRRGRDPQPDRGRRSRKFFVSTKVATFWRNLETFWRLRGWGSLWRQRQMLDRRRWLALAGARPDDAGLVRTASCRTRSTRSGGRGRSRSGVGLGTTEHELSGASKDGNSGSKTTGSGAEAEVDSAAGSSGSGVSGLRQTVRPGNPLGIRWEVLPEWGNPQRIRQRT